MNPPKTTKVPKSRLVEEKKQNQFQCNACDVRCNSELKLQYHIRRAHFNLVASTPLATDKQVNDVWVERVKNSSYLVEIQKTGPNTLVMKRMAPNSKVEISDHNQTDKIDLHSIYPTGSRKTTTTNIPCQICEKWFRGRDLKKHFQVAHQMDVIPEVKHTCNNCNMTFNRSYIYLKHDCTKDGTISEKKG